MCFPTAGRCDRRVKQTRDSEEIDSEEQDECHRAIHDSREFVSFAISLTPFPAAMCNSRTVRVRHDALFVRFLKLTDCLVADSRLQQKQLFEIWKTLQLF